MCNSFIILLVDLSHRYRIFLQDTRLNSATMYSLAALMSRRAATGTGTQRWPASWQSLLVSYFRIPIFIGLSTCRFSWRFLFIRFKQVSLAHPVDSVDSPRPFSYTLISILLIWCTRFILNSSLIGRSCQHWGWKGFFLRQVSECNDVYMFKFSFHK